MATDCCSLDVPTQVGLPHLRQTHSGSLSAKQSDSSNKDLRRCVAMKGVTTYARETNSQRGHPKKGSLSIVLPRPALVSSHARAAKAARSVTNNDTVAGGATVEFLHQVKNPRVPDVRHADRAESLRVSGGCKSEDTTHI